MSRDARETYVDLRGDVAGTLDAAEPEDLYSWFTYHHREQIVEVEIAAA